MKYIIIREDDYMTATAEVAGVGSRLRITAEVSDEWWSEYEDVVRKFEDFQIALYDMMDEDMNQGKHE